MAVPLEEFLVQEEIKEEHMINYLHQLSCMSRMWRIQNVS